MKTAYFSNAGKRIDTMVRFVEAGSDLIATRPDFDMFSPREARLIDWGSVERKEPSAFALFSEYGEIATDSYADWLELLFYTKNAKLASDGAEGKETEEVLAQLEAELDRSLSQSWNPHLLRMRCKALYLLGKTREAEAAARRLLMVRGAGEEALLLLVACAASEGDSEKAEKTLNCLANHPRHKRMLEMSLCEKRSEEKRRWLLRAAGDYAKAEEGI